MLLEKPLAQNVKQQNVVSMTVANGSESHLITRSMVLGLDNGKCS